MKRSIKYFIVLLIMIVTTTLAPAKTSHAASAKVWITSEATEFTVGESVLVYITISSDTAFGDFEANLTYDDEVLEYVGKHSFITGSSGFLRIKDMNIIEEEYDRKYALEFKAITVGTSKIAFQNSIMVYDFETGIEMAVSSNDMTVDVKAAETASTNAYLSALKISPSELNPPFDKEVFQYNTIVNNNTKKLVIDATRENESAVVQISGNDSLKEGENKINVTVVAESGNVIEYTINVFRESAPEEGETLNDGNSSPSTMHGSFQITTIEDELFAIYNGAYKLVKPGPEVEIPKNYIKTRIIISDTSIEVYAPENNLEYDFLLIYAENEMGEAGFYQYDRVEKTLQRYSQDNPLQYVDDVNSNPNEDKEKQYRNNLMKAVMVITILSIFSALMVVVSIRLYMNSNRSSKGRKRK